VLFFGSVLLQQQQQQLLLLLLLRARTQICVADFIKIKNKKFI